MNEKASATAADTPREYPHPDDQYYKLFINVLKYCTTQFAEPYAEIIFNWVQEDTYYEKKFKEWHPEAFWAANILVQRIRNFIESGQPLPKTKNELLNIAADIAEGIHFQLLEEISLFMAGMDPDFVIALSAEQYEGKDSKSVCMAIIPSIRDIPVDYRFSPCNQLQLIQENLHSVRKQLQLAGAGTLAVIKKENGVYYTVGILPQIGGNDKAYRYFRFVFKRHMCWWFCTPQKKEKVDALGKGSSYQHELDRMSCLVRFENGRWLLPEVDLQNEIEKYLSFFFGRHCGAIDLLRLLDEGSGTVILVADEAICQAEGKRLVQKFEKGIQFQEPVDLSGYTKENMRKQLDRYRGIDGSILVDLDGKIHACGLILDGQTKRKGKQGRGSRFNSTKTYIEFYAKFYHKPITGFVKSDDRMLDVLGNSGQ